MKGHNSLIIRDVTKRYGLVVKSRGSQGVFVDVPTEYFPVLGPERPSAHVLTLCSSINKNESGFDNRRRTSRSETLRPDSD